MKKIAVVMDVESVGLHGEGFSVGAVVVNLDDGRILEEFYAACPPDAAEGEVRVGGFGGGLGWVRAHHNPPAPTFQTPAEVRAAFWFWWKGTGAPLYADLPWPVEARFMLTALDEAVKRGDAMSYEGPRPLLDVASVRKGAGMCPFEDRLGFPERFNPLGEARESARLLVEALNVSKHAT